MDKGWQRYKEGVGRQDLGYRCEDKVYGWLAKDTGIRIWIGGYRLRKECRIS